MSQHGKFGWNELMSPDTGKARAFYTALFGWEAQEMTMADGESYTLWLAGGEPAGGMMSIAGPEFAGMAPHWTAYVQVDDVDATAAQVADLGGTVTKPPFDVEGVGRFAVVQDPTGAVIAFGTFAEQAES